MGKVLDNNCPLCGASIKYNPNYADCHLSQKGISQSISKQSFFNKFPRANNL